MLTLFSRFDEISDRDKKTLATV